MSSVVSFGTNTNAQRKRVYYEGSQTIQEGMPLCYNSDTTSNILGVDTGNSNAASTTTTEGGQNEGKFLRVEDPASTNLPFFAGVVAQGGWVGKAGPRYVDIFIPNGAIVPVRSSLSTTVNATVLAIRPAVYTLTNPVYGGSTTSFRPVAIALETVDRSSTNGLCLAKLDPTMFAWSGYGVSANKLMLGPAATSGDMYGGFLSFTTTATGGSLTGLRLRSELAGAGSSVIGLRCEGVIASGCTAQDGDSAAITSHLIFKSGATAGAYSFYGLEAKVENQDGTPANLSSGTRFAPLKLVTQISSTTPPPANSHYMIYCRVDGADKPDAFIKAEDANAVNLAAQSGAAVSHTIKIDVAGTAYYIMVSDAA